MEREVDERMLSLLTTVPVVGVFCSSNLNYFPRFSFLSRHAERELLAGVAVLSSVGSDWLARHRGRIVQPNFFVAHLTWLQRYNTSTKKMVSQEKHCRVHITTGELSTHSRRGSPPDGNQATKHTNVHIGGRVSQAW